jgi:hypothetical protein
MLRRQIATVSPENDQQAGVGAATNVAPWNAPRGDQADRTGLRPRHAQLSVGAAIALGTFLLQTSEDR